MPKVLLAIIDALASRVVQPALMAGALPNLAALGEAGGVRWDSTAIFPSITPAATAALVTGAYPADSGISGAYFYDQQSHQVRYYGDDLLPVMHQGFRNFFEEYLVNMNRERLRSEILYQTVERAGRRAACLNYLWYRGDTPHCVRIPWLLRFWPRVPWSTEVRGPQLLGLGDLVTLFRGTKTGHGGPLRRYGFNDRNTAAQLLELARKGPLPDLTVAYFPDNDFESHAQGPEKALRCVERFDACLGALASQFGGMQGLLDEVAMVITGDHSQSDLPLDEDDTQIALHELLEDFSVVPAGDDWQDEDLMVCPNMRAAQIYLHPRATHRIEEIIARLVDDSRIDQVIVRERPAGERVDHYRVCKREHGALRFWPANAEETGVVDPYGLRWAFSGSLSTLDAAVDSGSGRLVYGDYPNALERIAGAFDPAISGDIWLTARLGYEFRLPGTEINRRGSHGSLHALDSTSPLFVAGPDAIAALVRPPRSVDVAPLCLQIMGLPSRFGLGVSRVARPA